MDATAPAPVWLMRRLDKMEGKLDALIAREDSPVVGVPEAMKLVGARSRTALHRAMLRLGVASIGRGKWRRRDITNATGKEAMRKTQLARKRMEEAAASEAGAESRRKPSRPNPHDD